MWVTWLQQRLILKNTQIKIFCQQLPFCWAVKQGVPWPFGFHRYKCVYQTELSLPLDSCLVATTWCVLWSFLLPLQACPTAHARQVFTCLVQILLLHMNSNAVSLHHLQSHHGHAPFEMFQFSFCLSCVSPASLFQTLCLIHPIQLPLYSPAGPEATAVAAVLAMLATTLIGMLVLASFEETPALLDFSFFLPLESVVFSV